MTSYGTLVVFAGSLYFDLNFCIPGRYLMLTAIKVLIFIFVALAGYFGGCRFHDYVESKRGNHS